MLINSNIVSVFNTHIEQYIQSKNQASRALLNKNFLTINPVLRFLPPSFSYKRESLAEKTKSGQKRIAGPRQGYGQMETKPRDDDALWNIARRTPIKGRPGELETEFRAQFGKPSQSQTSR